MTSFPPNPLFRVLQRPFRVQQRLAVAALALATAQPLFAAPAAQDIFPQETVLWVSLPSAPRFQEKFSATQLGQLSDDELLAPFTQHLRTQAMQRFGNLRTSLGVSLDDVLAAAGGEFAMGVVHRPGTRAATLVMLDPSGKQAEAEQLIQKVDQELTARGGKKSNQTLAGVEVTVYNMPAGANQKITREELVRFETGGLLCFVENRAQAQALIARINGGGGANLTQRNGFAHTMRRCESARGGAPDVRWFLSPFDYDLAQRSREAKPKLADKEDTFTILRKQGFNAVQAIGGHVQVAVDADKDFVHRTAVYAPPKPGTAGKPASEKYELGMRMAQTPNRRDLAVENWAPRDTANYSTYSLDTQNAFEYFKSVFDAMAGVKNGFKNTLEGFEKDFYGPKIKVKQDIIVHLGDRITRMADYQLPITTDCERFLFVVEAKNPAALKKPIDKWMKNDDALPREVNGVKFWEIVPEEEIETTASLGGGLIPLDDQASDEQEPSLLQRAAVCVHQGNLIIASDVEYLKQVLFGVEPEESLAGSYDFQAAMQQLNQLPGVQTDRCSWSFARNDESIRPTYELLRQGKLPQGQTFFARLLNKLLTTAEDEEKGIVRHQRIDAHKLPTFELARRYFGPSARSVTAEDDGWFITGVVLNKAGG